MQIIIRNVKNASGFSKVAIASSYYYFGNRLITVPSSHLNLVSAGIFNCFILLPILALLIVVSGILH